ncbi:MAG TPA: UDP-N-acetylglucosamine 1-carboxyvinyltransferase, partial [Bacteroidales bacterium]|nr:UDP-N-acetylglucosamine 1-carboxyvinyltransferase [Bacteroidales bacterium]
MGSFIISGGNTLGGTIKPQGAKNEALQILCACLLTEDTINISNLPDILDVNNLIELLDGLGVDVKRTSRSDISLTAKNIQLDYLKSDAFIRRAASLRGSIMILGPLLARFHKAYLPHPGGDKIGRRRLDTHFIGLQKLGARFNEDSQNKCYDITAPNGLAGTYMLLDEASVTGTANVIMAAVLAQGTTSIFNAACEPYIVQLCQMLVRMGAQIQGIGSNLLTITGVEKLSGTSHRLLSDMIEVGSFIGMAAMTRSSIRIAEAGINSLGMIPQVFQKLGIKLHFEDDDIIIPQQDSYQVDTFMDGGIMTIADAPW